MAPSRDRALDLVELLGAGTHLITSLEYLATDRDRRRGGVNDWEVTGTGSRLHSRWGRAALSVVARRGVTTALHAARVVAAGALLLRTRHRLVADAVLVATQLLLHQRHHPGTDGADSTGFLVQCAAAVARAGRGRAALTDTALWFVSSQSVLAYAAAGWAKLAGRPWRDGSAVSAVMRTRTFGHPAVSAVLRQHPWLARATTWGTVALECGFPAVYVLGRRAPILVGLATVFHLANAPVMGLGRFAVAFSATHPAILYTAGPRTRPGPDGGPQNRDDTFPAATGLVAIGALTALGVTAWHRRRLVLRGRPGDRVLHTSAGSRLRYGQLGAASPVLITVHDAGSDATHWAALADALANTFTVITYDRAGYGPSTHRSGRTAGQVGLADLCDLVRATAVGRPVVLVGDGYGARLALRAAAHLGDRVSGVVALAPERPSSAAAVRRFLPWLRLGFGALLDLPAAVTGLPAGIRPVAEARLRDARSWSAALAEYAVDPQPGPSRCATTTIDAGFDLTDQDTVRTVVRLVTRFADDVAVGRDSPTCAGPDAP